MIPAAFPAHVAPAYAPLYTATATRQLVTRICIGSVEQSPGPVKRIWMNARIPYTSCLLSAHDYSTDAKPGNGENQANERAKHPKTHGEEAKIPLAAELPPQAHRRAPARPQYKSTPVSARQTGQGAGPDSPAPAPDFAASRRSKHAPFVGSCAVIRVDKQKRPNRLCEMLLPAYAGCDTTYHDSASAASVQANRARAKVIREHHLSGDMCFHCT